MAKQVLLINGSPRQGKNTATIIQKLAKILENENIKVKQLNLADYSFSGCCGCYGCLNDGKCKVEDEMQEIYPFIEKSEGLVLAAPTYNYNIPSSMKAFIDRMFCYYDFTTVEGWRTRLENHRYGLVISVCAGSSSEDMGFALQAMEKPLVALGYQVVATVPYYETRKKPVVHNKDFHNKLKKIGINLSNLL